MALLSPNHGGTRPLTLGVIIHSTRGGQAYGTEYQATLNWFANPASGVSAHAVIGRDGQIDFPVASDLEAWHAREYNRTWLGVEFEQPTITDSYTEAQYATGGGLLAAWAAEYGFPVDRLRVLGHSEISPGIADGKSDPGPTFDFDRLIAIGTGAEVPEGNPFQSASLSSLLVLCS